MNTTLRDVAKILSKSYGNLTYHYATKEDVIIALYKDLNSELTELQKPSGSENLLVYFLSLPSISYQITTKYLFFTLDFVEVKRNYPKVYAQISKSAEARKVKWLHLLKSLNELGYFKNLMDERELNYIMFLSGSVRSAYFQKLPREKYKESDYCLAVNLLLKPYLSEAGLKIYDNLPFLY